MTENNNDKNCQPPTDIQKCKEDNELKIIESHDVVDAPNYVNDIVKPVRDETSDPFSEACTQSLEDNIGQTNEIEKKKRPTLKNKSNLKLPKIKDEQLYQNDIFARSEAEVRIQQAIEHDYLFQPSNIKVESQSPKFKPNNFYNNGSRHTPHQSDLFLYSPTEEPKFTIDTPTSDICQITLNAKDMRSNASIKSGKENCPLNGQEELAEIITDFKNNVFTIHEVEKLVMDWKNRNETQQSLKEKQDQLNKMREEYDKIQQKIKDKMKRPTPFERVKKMFSKNKNKRTYLHNL